MAVRVGSGDPEYLDGDQHGTMATVYDPDSKAVVRRQFDPYGNQVGGVTATSATTVATTQSAWPDQHGFLNDPVDTSTELTDIGARQYDPTTGRFISVDPQLNPADPQSMTGYAYADDDPASDSDPTGLYCIAMDDGSRKCPTASGSGGSGSSGGSGGSAGNSKQNAKDTNAEAIAKLGAAKVAAAQKLLHTSMLDTLVKAGGDFLKGMLGITDIENCIGHGDVGSCVSLVLSILPWDRIIEEGVNLVKGIVRGIDAVRDLVKATEDAQKVMKEVSDTEQEIKDADLAAKAMDDSSVSNAGHGEEPAPPDPEPNGGSPKDGGEGDGGGHDVGPRKGDNSGSGTSTGATGPTKIESNDPGERTVGKPGEGTGLKIANSLARDGAAKMTDVWNNITANGVDTGAQQGTASVAGAGHAAGGAAERHGE
ncbi:MAG TPA: RHS repeat-associated core domain-containing protein [Pseudonocardiaceae bacterium]